MASPEASVETRGGRLVRADRLVPVTAPGGPRSAEGCATRLIAEPEAFRRRTASRGRPAVVFCFAGGGYAKEYFDPAPPLGEAYSMASYFARRGFAVVLCDHVGTGASTHPADPQRLGPRQIADLDAQAVSGVMAQLASGLFSVEGMPPIRGAQLFGVAHSMGGGLLVLQQARHPRFDAIATMGWSALRMPSSAELAELDGLAPAQASSPGAAPGGTTTSPGRPGYLLVRRGPLQHAAYHWPDVPEWVIAADDAVASDLPAPLANAMNAPRAVAAEAASIQVPVLVLMGEHDLRMPGSEETSAYPAAARVDYVEIPRCGHCHNLAGTRRLAWERVADWLEDVA